MTGAVSTDGGDMPAAGRVSDDGDPGQAVEKHGERTDRIRTELGNLYLAVTFDESGRPFEVFGWIGKTGTFGHGMTELACRLLSLHLRRGTPIEEIIEQCRGIRDMAPTPNRLDDGTVVWNTGVGDASAQVLQEFVSHSGTND